MSWGEVKHAVNSTVGTSNFKPLDQIIKEEAGNLSADFENGNKIVGLAKSFDDAFDFEKTSSSPRWSVKLDSGVYLVLIIGNRTSSYDDCCAAGILNVYSKIPEYRTHICKIDVGYSLVFTPELEDVYYVCESGVNSTIDETISIRDYDGKVGDYEWVLKIKKIL